MRPVYDWRSAARSSSLGRLDRLSLPRPPAIRPMNVQRDDRRDDNGRNPMAGLDGLVTRNLLRPEKPVPGRPRVTCRPRGPIVTKRRAPMSRGMLSALSHESVFTGHYSPPCRSLI
jgi:hypothetical protein